MNKVAWLFSEDKFNLKDPNLRIKQFIHAQMLLSGWQSWVTSDPSKLWDADVVICCSVDQRTLDIIKECKRRGIKTLFHHMESIFGLPLQEEIFRAVDTVVCVSAGLAYMTETRYAHGRCIHIDDPADSRFFNHTPYPEKHSTLTCVYAGGSPYLAELYRPHVEKAGLDFKVLSYPNDGRDYFREPDDYGGDPYWWLDEYRKCHIALCAHDTNSGMNKSIIKIVTAWSNKLLPVVSPIPSYRSVVEQNINGFIYHSFEHLTDILKNHVNDRARLIEAGFSKVKNYSTGAVADRWMQLIKMLTFKH